MLYPCMHKFQYLFEEIEFSFSVDTPNVETIAIPVLSATVGLFGAVTLTAIVAAFLVCMYVCRKKKNEGRYIIVANMLA